MGLIAWLHAEPPEQLAHNQATFQKPDHVSWEDWSRRFTGYECSWYDPNPNRRGCSGGTHHDHRRRIDHWYWASPLSLIIPPLYFLWEARWFVFSGILERLGWYRLLERFGVDTSPR